jgi:hypothetical protein
LINTLFNTALYAKKVVPDPKQEKSKTVMIESITAGEIHFSIRPFPFSSTRVHHPNHVVWNLLELLGSLGRDMMG